MQKRKWASVLVVVIVAAIAVYIYFFTGSHSSAVATDDQHYTVNVDKAVQANIPNTVPALGTLAAPDIVTISSDTDGRVKSIHFKNGSNVTKGMPIISLDAEQAQADYNTAVTQYNLAKLKYERYSSLGTDAVSGQELATYKADSDNAQQDVKNKQATLDQYTISAPFDGTLGAFKVNEGDHISAGDAMVTLVNTSQLRAEYTIPEAYLPELKKGQSATITVSAYPKDTFYGTVSYVSPTVDKDTRTIAVQALVDNAKGSLSPGMFIKVSQHISDTAGALVVPDQAVMADIKGYYVFLVDGDKVSQTYVKIGQRQSGKVEILSGLKVGDTVVTAGQQKLDDGSLVEIIKAEIAKSSSDDSGDTASSTTPSSDKDQVSSGANAPDSDQDQASTNDEKAAQQVSASPSDHSVADSAASAPVSSDSVSTKAETATPTP